VNRSILALALVLAVVAPVTALAEDAKPTPAQLEKAKKAFAAGKKLFDKGDFPEAVAKFKESYNLSKNPVLLYNIAFANESAGQDDIALFYYRKFLTDAPADAAQRTEVQDRVKTLEKKFQTGMEPAKGEPAKAEPTKREPVKIKPAGTYGEADFQHQTVDVAPPKKPLDVTAYVPEDSGFQVTLHFRTAGEGTFTSKPMKWRYKELVARVPPEKMLGDSIQYYIEGRDAAGKVVTRAGKSTSPNLVTLEPGAPAWFYPDFSESGEVMSSAETQADDTEEDPLTGKKKKAKKKVVADEYEAESEQPMGLQQGYGDVGSKKFKYVKWGSTGTAGVMLGLSVAFYISAGNYASALEEDSVMCGAPPCREFDQTAKDWESAGKRNQTISRVTFGVGLGAAALAGYYWYKEFKAKKRGELKVSGTSASPETSWSIAPAFGDGYTGAAAAARF
jgi:hypothetical protein